MGRLTRIAVVMIAACAVGVGQGRTSFVRASGEGVVSVKPDIVRVSVGVTTQAETAQAAADDNAARSTAVIAALRRLLGQDAEIKTLSYSVTANYRYPTGGGQPTLTGYTANNTIEVTTGDLSQPGRIFDTATQAGATNVGGLRFGLKDPAPVRRQALRAATQQAKLNAEAIASGLNARIGTVVSVEESSAVRVVSNTDSRAGATAATTPIESGQVEISAWVVLEAELLP